MEPSILLSTKQILGLARDFDEFDVDIKTHINSVFAVVNQLGVGPAESFVVLSEDETWGSLELPSDQLGILRSYVFLKVKMLWDPPATSYLLEAYTKQIAEYEWRLNAMREEALYNAGS